LFNLSYKQNLSHKMKTINSVPPKERKEWRDLLTGNLNIPLKNFFFQMKVTQAKNQIAMGKITLDEAIDDIHALCKKFFKAKNMDVDLANIFLNSNELTTSDDVYGTTTEISTESNGQSQNENVTTAERKKQEMLELLKVKEEKMRLERERQKLQEERRKLEAERIRLEAEKTIQEKLLKEKLKLKKQYEELKQQEPFDKSDNTEVIEDNNELNEVKNELDKLFSEYKTEEDSPRKRSFFSRMFGIFKK